MIIHSYIYLATWVGQCQNKHHILKEPFEECNPFASPGMGEGDGGRDAERWRRREGVCLPNTSELKWGFCTRLKPVSLASFSVTLWGWAQYRGGVERGTGELHWGWGREERGVGAERGRCVGERAGPSVLHPGADQSDRKSTRLNSSHL